MLPTGPWFGCAKILASDSGGLRLSLSFQVPGTCRPPRVAQVSVILPGGNLQSPFPVPKL